MTFNIQQDVSPSPEEKATEKNNTEEKANKEKSTREERTKDHPNGEVSIEVDALEVSPSQLTETLDSNVSAADNKILFLWIPF